LYTDEVATSGIATGGLLNRWAWEAESFVNHLCECHSSQLWQLKANYSLSKLQ